MTRVPECGPPAEGAADAAAPGPFAAALARSGKTLARGAAATLQVNVGLLCNQACRHCHLGAGPGRPEVMGRAVMAQVVACARRCAFPTVDVTGGAPELVPGIEAFLGELAAAAPRLIFRANLTALAGRAPLVALLAGLGARVVASFPSLSESQTDAQRGRGVFAASLEGLRRLNAAGFGQEGSGLELDLVSNPVGAFLPPAQDEAQRRFRGELERRWGIRFGRLYTFANVPLGRFREWLCATGNLEEYLRRLEGRFNPCAVDGLMCRTLVSVGWDGTLHDCDFNLALGIPLGGTCRHVSELAAPPEAGAAIATGDHCFACTAGSGFT